jgi:hypothetical protein
LAGAGHLAGELGCRHEMTPGAQASAGAAQRLPVLGCTPAGPDTVLFDPFPVLVAGLRRIGTFDVPGRGAARRAFGRIMPRACCMLMVRTMMESRDHPRRALGLVAARLQRRQDLLPASDLSSAQSSTVTSPQRRLKLARPPSDVAKKGGLRKGAAGMTRVGRATSPAERSASRRGATPPVRPRPPQAQ